MSAIMHEEKLSEDSLTSGGRGLAVVVARVCLDLRRKSKDGFPWGNIRIEQK
ncbi:Uncharacterized protein TCM_046770 [Theobroma cacao]|uniref:Uncharacterized protein n=1 Tax=Theobroma cacao TaxID=3641 RepID=A0A061ELU7_THECC|nr:Uncharacterized protein TCM_046770 [Theobroma cacao]